ncbi:TolB family protein [Sediminibacterium ginsengisoli]|uniref:WD40-like Beta Propeller Repeat n=1 Tax=Sediminibacterium ginsengisoli TaxID=413434 RepID=A0A1T4L495_9BACT|nr:DPP IV N-terminal domain-containing protein [Sediminibacterium ginsengisoli]SJZ49438.1 WD40-like Beta Propeller Repeat [Sediminibacterium ginsengisoli]
MKKNILFLAAAFLVQTALPAQQAPQDSVHFSGEKHFRNVRQLTFGGDNAEAYWSYDGKHIIFQRTNPKEGLNCDQIFIGKVPESANEPFVYKQVSTGKGRTTCAYFLPDGKHIIYASTHKGGDACPPVPDRSKYGNKYIWPLYDSYDIYMADLNGKIVRQLTTAKGYDAEATLSPDGKKMIYCSDKNGDLDLYVMDIATGKEKQVTTALGYDGGAWFSPDGKKIVWRASRPKTEAAIKEYKELLAQGMVAPTNMEVWVANADGTDAKQITDLKQANWAPNFTPDGKHIIFCSNHEYPRGFPFNMYLTDINGKGLEKISRDKGFDAFPMFSPDGKKIIFSSNRNNGGTRDTNLFIADWVD